MSTRKTLVTCDLIKQNESHVSPGLKSVLDSIKINASAMFTSWVYLCAARVSVPPHIHEQLNATDADIAQHHFHATSPPKCWWIAISTPQWLSFVPCHPVYLPMFKNRAAKTCYTFENFAELAIVQFIIGSYKSSNVPLKRAHVTHYPSNVTLSPIPRFSSYEY